MTEKGEKILDSALELFVKNGFDGTSTIEIARKAGVSEALIFKHFKSKAGLLEAIIKKGQEILSKPIQNILNENTPEKIIKKTLELPIMFYSDESQFWKLMMDFKSKNKEVSELMHNEQTFEQLMKRIESAFEILNFKEPKNETNLLFIIVMGLSKLIFDEKQHAVCLETIDFLKNKYKLNS